MPLLDNLIEFYMIAKNDLIPYHYKAIYLDNSLEYYRHKSRTQCSYKATTLTQLFQSSQFIIFEACPSTHNPLPLLL